MAPGYGRHMLFRFYTCNVARNHNTVRPPPCTHRRRTTAHPKPITKKVGAGHIAANLPRIAPRVDQQTIEARDTGRIVVRRAGLFPCNNLYYFLYILFDIDKNKHYIILRGSLGRVKQPLELSANGLLVGANNIIGVMFD